MHLQLDTSGGGYLPTSPGSTGGVSDAVYIIDRDAYRTIRDWCRKSPRREVGGLLAGDGRYIARAIKVPNVAERPQCSYEWTDADVSAARRQLRAEGVRVVGQWHSHPHGYARPSRFDLACHSGLELIWPGRSSTPRLWRLRGTMREVLRRELGLVVGKLLNAPGPGFRP